jgi:CheY-like chemotaxis protein
MYSRAPQQDTIRLTALDANIVRVTAVDPSHPFRAQCFAAGMDDYLSKPLNGKLLHQCIAKWTKT